MSDKTKQPRVLQAIPNPSEVMRARHPDLFSDTRIAETPRLPKAVFEYHLETLTSRKQEYEFEHFCRKLAEKEICPNLRVQTGPTGGGDSKVDTETYPVAAEIAERWWVGAPSAGTERWAFAFSAKKAWKDKLKKDIENILSTGRNYQRIYFFTNQFVSDKERSKQEDALSRGAGIPVHIVDRAWIVAKVYDNDRLDLAISALGIEGVGSESSRNPGPRDSVRLAELEELDRQVPDPDRYQMARYQLVEDCLRSAILARGLERPRNEVEGRFLQADRLAQELNIPQQRMRIAYNRAWTAYWWYEDYAGFNRLYDEVERWLNGSIQAAEVERLVTLWQLLGPTVAAGRLSTQEAQVEPRRNRLEAMLQGIASDSARPNNALQARTSLALIKLTKAYLDNSADKQKAVWTELSKITDESLALGAYPMEHLSDLIQEIGQHVDSPEFDALYEKVVDVIRQRRSEGEAGEAYNQRGIQKLQHNKPYEAIQWFGRAEELLIKEEYRRELVLALGGSSIAYEQAGLIWAARNKILAAVERSLVVFMESGEIISPALQALQRLAWIELELGRISHVLNTMLLARTIAANLKLSEDRLDAYEKEVMMQEAVLGIHLLNIPFEALPELSRFPDVLERLGLTNAKLPLLFTLGHEKAIYDEQYFSASDSKEKLQTYFDRWHDQPATKDITPDPVLIVGPTSLLRSRILGTEVVVQTPNDPTSFGIVESLLGTLEAFLATSNEDDLLPHIERFTISVTQSSSLTRIPEIHFVEDDGNRAEIVHPVDFEFSSAEDIHHFRDWLQETVIALLSRVFVIRDVEAWMEKIAGQERAFSRALIFGDALTLDRNVFGEKPKFRLSDWIEAEDKAYERLRDRPWRLAQTPDLDDASQRKPPKFESGPPPEDLIDKSRLKHTDRQVMSPIDVALWDRAKWCGTLFGEAEGSPPFLGIVFREGQIGKAIFKGWRERWGSGGVDKVLRVAIITGVSAQHPAHYVVTLGPNLTQFKGSGSKTFITISRINRMEPASSANLDRFLSAYRRYGTYFLVPVQIGPEGAPPEPDYQLYLVKQELDVRPAWQIAENDIDIMALQDDDNPIIPPGVSDPPVNKALQWRRALKKRD